MSGSKKDNRPGGPCLPNITDIHASIKTPSWNKRYGCESLRILGDSQGPTRRARVHVSGCGPPLCPYGRLEGFSISIRRRLCTGFSIGGPRREMCSGPAFPKFPSWRGLGPPEPRLASTLPPASPPRATKRSSDARKKGEDAGRRPLGMPSVGTRRPTPPPDRPGRSVGWVNAYASRSASSLYVRSAGAPRRPSKTPLASAA